MKQNRHKSVIQSDSAPRVLVHVSLPETDQTQTFWHFWQIASQGWPLLNIPPGRTDQQRNTAVQMLLRSEGTHLVLLDHDHFHAKNIVFDLVRCILEDRERLFVAGLNYSRHDGSPTATVVKDGRAVKLDPAEYPAGSLVEVFSCGPGSAIIDRRLFEQISPPWFAYTYHMSEREQLLHPGTDAWFCQRVREAGISMWVHTGLVSPHITHGLVPDNAFIPGNGRPIGQPAQRA